MSTVWWKFADKRGTVIKSFTAIVNGRRTKAVKRNKLNEEVLFDVIVYNTQGQINNWDKSLPDD